MREVSVPDEVDVPVDGNLTDAVFDHASGHPDDVLFERKVSGSWQPVSAKDFAEQVRSVAAGLVASGVQPGDRVGLMSATRYEWTLLDYAIWASGAVTVPIYETSSPEQLAWNLSDSGAVAVVLETTGHRQAFASVAEGLPDVRASWVLDEGAVDRLVAAGRDVTEEEIRRRRATLRAESLATVIYTSGTTGRPKGCELTHGNFLFDAASTTSGLGELFESGSTLLFLPLAHVFARVIQVGCVLNRVRLGHTSDIKNLMADMQAFRPTFILSVPRVFEKIYNTAGQQAHSAAPVLGLLPRGRIFDRADAVAVAYSEAVDRGGAGLLLRAEHALFDRLVYGRLRAAVGGRVRYAVSGGAPLGARLGHFFRGAGITVLEGYGLTETTAGATVNRPDALRVGTVGRPVAGVSLRIADDGEVLVRGRNIFRGYWRNPQATGETVDADGWFHTGDIGRLDDEGYLTITGRKKELIVTAGGKNVAPAVLEDRLRGHPLISQCLVVGDGRPYIAALITLDTDALPGWRAAHGKPDGHGPAELADDPDLRAEIQAAVDAANQAVSRAEGIRKFVVLPVDFTEEGGQLTPTLKVRRAVVTQQFAEQIDALYAG